MRLNASFLCAFVSLLFATQADAHRGHHHSHGESPSKFPSAGENRRAVALKLIGESYQRIVQPIFKKKCTDCHSTETQYPWYYKVPGVKQLIDSDVKEAREHLDFTPGFPFRSHASPEEDLTAIRESIQDNSMPPFSYRLLHPGSTLSEKDKKTVFNWVDQSITALSK